MPDREHIGLDNPAFQGRLRQPKARERPVRVVVGPLSRPPAGYFDQVYTSLEPADKPVREQMSAPRFAATAVSPPISVIKPQPFAKPASPRPQSSRVLRRQSVGLPGAKHAAKSKPRGYSKLQMSLVGMACLVFIAGLAVSVQTLGINKNAAAQVSALAKSANKPAANNKSGPAVPSTSKPSAQSLSQYVVAPDLARYLKIPKLGVNARVLQVGITSSGALGTPGNVYDTAWYTGSSKPGQPGATLIDGHVSSWTTHGVFYGLKTLAAGDTIQVVRGDGTVLNYQVVKTQVYNSSNVDMQAAITPVTAGKSGLNLITCTGQVKPGTSEFNQRVIVFAQQI